jgi:tetratricopeptide (TPR) repeat protein
MSARRACTRLAILLIGTSLLSHLAVGFEIDYDPRRPTELSSCDEHQHRGRLEEAKQCYAQVLSSSANLLSQAEAAWRLHDVRRANDLFRNLLRTQPDAVHPRIRWGRLYLQTHQYAQAVDLFREALKLSPDDAQAKLALARVYADRFEGGARPLLEEILKDDDEVLGAHLLAARMSLEEGQLEQAQTSLNRAAKLAARQKQPPLEVNALRAGFELARGRDPERWLQRVRDYNPHYGAAYEQLAHFEIMRRRYREATERLRQAVAAQPNLWSAHAELGLNLLRLGQLGEARRHLTTAYSGDPYSPSIVNSLRLLDRIDEFVLLKSTREAPGGPVELQLRLHENEAQVLQPYVVELASSAIETFSTRYGFALQEPLTVEFYPDHDDFAVRVAALPGIGLLGVTFGSVVAMDSPSGRARGDFHWGTTLWHELAHVFTLEATDHLVPRWLSEGISVFEEWRTGPTPGVAIPPEVMLALRDGKFLPVADLDSGFIRPSYPGQIQVSYVQSGLVCLFIEHRWGFERLTILLKQFTREISTAQAVKAALEIEPAAFDREFDAFLRERFAQTLANLDEFQAHDEAARTALKNEQWAEAIEPARRAVDWYPEHVGPGSPALVLAQALEKSGRRAEAIDALQAYREAGGWDPAAMRELARWLDEAGRTQDATAVLNSVNYADPLAPDLHAQLGERLLEGGDPSAALREFKVLLSMTEADRPAAHFGVARALRALGESEESRRQLLEALAAAPHFRPAQALLLETIEERAQ